MYQGFFSRVRGSLLPYGFCLPTFFFLLIYFYFYLFFTYFLSPGRALPNAAGVCERARGWVGGWVVVCVCVIVCVRV